MRFVLHCKMKKIGHDNGQETYIFNDAYSNSLTFVKIDNNDLSYKKELYIYAIENILESFF